MHTNILPGTTSRELQVISVISVSPSPVKSGSSVTLYTNLAGEEEYVKVPDIFSLDIEQANEIIVNSGLKIKITSNKGSVVTSQSPAANELVKKGTVVSVTTGG